MQIKLTDTDGKEVLAETDMIKSLYDRGPHRELTLHFAGMIKIRETQKAEWAAKYRKEINDRRTVRENRNKLWEMIK